MYLFFDTETNGLPKSWNAHVHDLDNWPRMIQLAWAHYDENKNKLAEHCYIIKPEGFEIGEETAKINRITQERAEKEGVPLKYALGMFAMTVKQSKFLVAHNVSFDKAVIGSEFIRSGMEEFYEAIKDIEKICTMNSSTDFCKIPGSHGYKWPKLEELYEKLFNAEVDDNLHDALIDVRVMVECFFELKKLKVIKNDERSN
ncbi:MAG: 3'-5' exonuclease [Patescibacteria group bacterium]